MRKNKNASDVYAASRFMYILEAAFEYFFTISISGVYLAEITKHIGLSDALTGIITSLISLGSGFQLISIFLAHKKPVKRWVSFGHVISQALFILMYFIPLFDLSMQARTALLIGAIILGEMIHHTINSPKINWFMSLVDDHKRGGFTAVKEIFSLVGGMIFSYSLGMIMDKFESERAFLIVGAILSVVLGLHTLTLVLSKEKPEQVEKLNVKESIGALAKNSALKKLIVVFILYNVSQCATTAFIGAYQINALGFSTTFASLVVIISSIARIIFSIPLGRFADKHSFYKMLYICFAIEAVAYTINAFTVPENGKILFTIYSIIHAVGLAGISSSIINLTYDYVPSEQRVGAFAVVNASLGIAGFLTVLALSPLVDLIQRNGNRVLGLSMYPQQLLSVFSALVSVVIIVYIAKVVSRLPRR